MKKLYRVMIAGALTALAAASPSFAEFKEWRVDAAHSYVGFKVRHMMVSWVRGQFSSVNGKVWLDPDDPPQTKVEVEIDAASIDTRNERRDKHLRSEDFFEVERFPKITFASRKVQGDPRSGLKLVGDLTIRGVTKEVVLDVEGPAPVVAGARGGEKTGVSASGTISRKDFGITWNRAIEAGGVTVSDEVILEIEAELTTGGAREAQRKTAE